MPKVAVVMGSDSDLPVLEKAIDLLADLVSRGSWGYIRPQDPGCGGEVCQGAQRSEWS